MGWGEGKTGGGVKVLNVTCVFVKYFCIHVFCAEAEGHEAIIQLLIL